MVRWQPDSAERLQQAALELYAERGYEDTTVAAIAERTGLTERTFYRHFADKREVLFDGAAELQNRVVAQVTAAPADRGALETAVAAFASLSPFFDARRAWSVKRRAIVAASPDLRERELIKRVALAAAIGEALRDRGVPAAEATLAAELAVTVFWLAYDAWAEDPEERAYAEHVEERLAELRATVG